VEQLEQLPKRTRGRPRTGSVTPHDDHFDVRITLADGTRGNSRCLPRGTSRTRAYEIARAMTEREIEDAQRDQREAAQAAAAAAAEPPKPQGETWAAWAEQWFAARDKKDLVCVKDDRSHFRKWIPEELKSRPMATITAADLERLVEFLDQAVLDDEITWKTATNIWGTVTKMFVDARKSKTLALRILVTNPCIDVAGPDVGDPKSKTYLYPAEFLQLVSCERVPLRWRRLFTLAVYMYPRPGELEALHREDVDRVHRVALIHRGIDRTSGELKGTKTGNTRRIPIETALMPLLDRMYAEEDPSVGLRVVRMPYVSDLSDRLRRYLQWAGVTRAELFANDKTRKRITFYDLRATGITWMALRGDEPLKIMYRAGHQHFRTTQGYVRAAEELVHAIGSGDVFPALPQAVFSSNISSGEAEDDDVLREMKAEEPHTQRDSNPMG
jgi:integrase